MYIFETSWEVCNRVGGIYAVLSTRAASMQRIAKDKVFFFGPDIERMFGGTPSPYFTETKSLLPTWQKQAEKAGLHLRIGRQEAEYIRADEVHEHAAERHQQHAEPGRHPGKALG